MTNSARDNYINRLLRHDEGEYKDGGNPHLPFGLCEKFGIKLPEDATPEIAWKALDDYGIKKEDAIASLEEFGDTSHIGESEETGKSEDREEPTGSEEEMEFFNKNFLNHYKDAELEVNQGNFTLAEWEYEHAIKDLEWAFNNDKTAQKIKEQNPKLYAVMQKRCEVAKTELEQIKILEKLDVSATDIFDFDTWQLDNDALSKTLDKIDNNPYMFEHMDFMNAVENDLFRYKNIVTDVASKLETLYKNDKISDDEKTQKFKEVEKNLKATYEQVHKGEYNFKDCTPLYKKMMESYLWLMTMNRDLQDYIKRTIASRTFTYKDAAEGKYNSVQPTEQNAIEGSYKKFGDECFTKERKDGAVWCQDEYESLEKFGNSVGVRSWGVTREQQTAIDYYTDEDGEFLNVFLNGYSGGYSPNCYSGVGNVDFTRDYMHNMTIGDHIDAITEVVGERELEEDTWVQRGVGPNMMKMLFGLDAYSEDALADAVNSGKPVHQYSFCSCGAARGTGFTEKPIILNIYCPKGTSAAYIATISKFSGLSGLGADGTVGKENEMLIQRDTTFRPTKFTKGKDGKIYIDLEIIEQAPIDYSKTNSYKNS